jgi:hypothetical protein
MVIKDTAYAALFDKKDLPSLYKLMETVRITHDQTLVDDFNLKCQKKVDDHNPILEVGNQKIEFEQVSKSDDLVVIGGINLLIDQILGTSVVRWIAIKIGTGTAAPTTADTVLATNFGNGVNMQVQGWTEYASSSLRFAAIFGETSATVTVNESAISTSILTGTLLNRNVFSNNPISHIINTTGFVISSIIEFVPVM